MGTDIVEVQRIEQLLERWGAKFLKKMYTRSETEYCAGQAYPAIHFAGRFAAKEAVRKALSAAGRTRSLPWHQIEITRERSGVPIVSVRDEHRPIAISISHTAEHAVATAVIQTDD